MTKLILSVLCSLTFVTTAFSSSHDLASSFKTELIESSLSTDEHLLIDEQVNPGEIIASAEKIVALGEALYTLFQKGKPSSQVKYAPISIIPRDPITKEPADLFDLEGEADPVRKKYIVSKKNGLGKEVCRLEFLIHFTPGRSYLGAGQYITNAAVIPLKANTLYGWDLDATMAVTGIGVKGKKANQVATATLTVNYKLQSFVTSLNESVVIDIDGTGKVFITE